MAVLSNESLIGGNGRFAFVYDRVSIPVKIFQVLYKQGV